VCVKPVVASGRFCLNLS